MRTEADQETGLPADARAAAHRLYIFSGLAPGMKCGLQARADLIGIAKPPRDLDSATVARHHRERRVAARLDGGNIAQLNLLGEAETISDSNCILGDRTRGEQCLEDKKWTQRDSGPLDPSYPPGSAYECGRDYK